MLINNKQSSLAQKLRSTEANNLDLEEQKLIVKLATEIVLTNFSNGEILRDIAQVKNHLRILIQDKVDEVVCALFLDDSRKVLSFDELFK